MALLSKDKDKEKEVEKTVNFDDYEKKYKENGNYYEDGKVVFRITEDNFGLLWKYVDDDNITDVDYNGTDLWLTDINNKRQKIVDLDITKDFIEQFAQRIANIKSVDFNQKNAVIEIETDTLRVSILHNSTAVSGTSICIRKTPPFQRITESYALEKMYCSKRIMCLIANCIKAHMNIIFCGQPRAGKTEAIKFFSNYIPDEERVITIEDVMELRYKELKPLSDCVEIKCNEDMNYEDAIIASLKQNPKWIMIAETRGPEVMNLIQGFSTGVNGITTLHTDHIAKIPQRMVNMVNDGNVEDRILNNVYEFIDVGVLISIKKDENGNLYRFIDQIGFFTSEEKGTNNDNSVKMCVNNGKIIREELPSNITNRFLKAGVVDLFNNEQVNERLKAQGVNVAEVEAKENKRARNSFETIRNVAEKENSEEELPPEDVEELEPPDKMYPRHEYNEESVPVDIEIDSEADIDEDDIELEAQNDFGVEAPRKRRKMNKS